MAQSQDILEQMRQFCCSGAMPELRAGLGLSFAGSSPIILIQGTALLGSDDSGAPGTA